MRRPSLLPALLLLAASACGGEAAPAGSPSASSPAPGTTTSPSGAVFGRGSVSIETSSEAVTLDVEIAESDEAHAQGLMGRTELAPEAGMIFVFADERPRSFWMKDTLIPLSIAFADSTGRIVTILDMEPCEADPCPLYDSGAPAQLALEVNQGYFQERGVATGDVMTVAEA